jgi:gliding motility-associated-like protein
MNKKLFLFIFPLIFLQCNKASDAIVSVHCEGLVNDPLPASDNGRVVVPTAFTPNGDGRNDQFRPITRGLRSMSVKVFDSNSNMLYQSDQLNSSWSPAVSTSKAQAYYYRIEAVTTANNKIGLCGQVFALSCLPTGTVKEDYSFEDQWSGNGFTLVSSESLSPCN